MKETPKSFIINKKEGEPDMEILYQDNRIVVCVKPAGVLSTDEPGGLPGLLRAEICGESNTCIRTVHRLDRVVGGVMVLARSREAARRLSAQIQGRGAKKTYIAVVEGTVPKQQDTWTDLLWRCKEEKKTYVVPEPGKGVQEAVLSYRVLACREGMTLVEIQLQTGRTHQIRAQFSSRGFPIVGDKKYGASPREMAGIALWCRSMGFEHPQTGEELLFSALPPKVEPWNYFEKLYAET